MQWDRNLRSASRQSRDTCLWNRRHFGGEARKDDEAPVKWQRPCPGGRPPNPMIERCPPPKTSHRLTLQLANPSGVILEFAMRAFQSRSWSQWWCLLCHGLSRLWPLKFVGEIAGFGFDELHERGACLSAEDSEGTFCRYFGLVSMTFANCRKPSKFRPFCATSKPFGVIKEPVSVCCRFPAQIEGRCGHTAAEASVRLIWNPSGNSSGIWNFGVKATKKHKIQKNLPRDLHYWSLDFRLILEKTRSTKNLMAIWCHIISNGIKTDINFKFHQIILHIKENKFYL